MVLPPSNRGREDFSGLILRVGVMYKLKREFEGSSYRELKELAMLGENIYEYISPDKLFPEDYGQIPSVSISLEDIKSWREEWLDENDPEDGTDCVTPFDKYLY